MSSENQRTKLHLGCGYLVKESWLHLDPARARVGNRMDDNFASSFPNSVWERDCRRNSVSVAGRRACADARTGQRS